jgi:hypothetical protein
LVALLVSIAFLSIHLTIKPCRRREDNVLMMMTELSLVLIYLCVLVIKTCDLSALRSTRRDADEIARAICSTYGFGDDSAGKILTALPVEVSCTCACDTNSSVARADSSVSSSIPDVTLQNRCVRVLHLLRAVGSALAACHWTGESLHSRLVRSAVRTPIGIANGTAEATRLISCSQRPESDPPRQGAWRLPVANRKTSHEAQVSESTHM